MNNKPINTSKDNNRAGKASILARRLNWSGLSYPQKFTVVAIIFALPLIAFAPLILGRYTYIDQYGYKEAQGTVYLREVWQLTGDLQLFHTALIRYENRLESSAIIDEAQLKVDTDLIALKSAGEQYDTALGIDFDFNEFQAEWDNLKNKVQSEVEQGANAQAGETSRDSEMSAMYANIGQLIKQIGDKSYLILDPDLDTYYMMETVLLKLPENQSLVFELWRLTEAQDLTDAELFKIDSLRSRIEANLLTMEQGIQTALQNNSNGFMSPIIFEPFQNYLTATRSFTDLIRKNILETQSIQINSETVYTSYRSASESGNDFYQAASQALESGIETRIASSNFSLYASLLITAASVLAAFAIGISMMRSINRPLLALISATGKLAAGEMSTRVAVTSSDEVGRASLAFNKMAEDVEENRIILKANAAELERRTNLLKAVADVGKAITSFRDLSELLQKTTFLIHENFGYYHVGIFLLDEHKEYAILTATNSEGGGRMLERRHRLKVGETSIVGYVTQNARARIALDVGRDAVYFDNPDLPQTRSEMALPLVVGGQILGALDVQSIESQAFSEEDSSTLQILVEQLAVTIQNANLFNETAKALEAARAAYSNVSREAWSKILRTQPRTGFIATPPTTTQTQSETIEPSIAKAFETGEIIVGTDNITISIPVKVRGQTIGAMRLKKAEISEAWTQEEINLAISLSDQLSGALESARLYRESQQRGARESLVSDISARISAVSNTETIVRETVQELGQALGNASVTFQLLAQSNGHQQPEDRSAAPDIVRKAGE